MREEKNYRLFVGGHCFVGELVNTGDWCTLFCVKTSREKNKQTDFSLASIDYILCDLAEVRVCCLRKKKREKCIRLTFMNDDTDTCD
jgi:hypothetical protein